MFSNTAYEAMYQYIGLELHGKFVDIITSEKVLLAIVLLTFGFMFFQTTVHFFSRYMPGALVSRKSVPLSQYVKITALLFLSLSLLKVGSQQSVKRFNGESWHDNSYVLGHAKHATAQYRVSLIFDLLSRSAEEVAALIARVTDQVFQTAHSQLEAPNFFFKAVMYGAVTTIEDPALKGAITLYTDECFDRVLPLIGDLKAQNKLDGFFADNSGFDAKLAELPIQMADRSAYTCLDLKNQVRQKTREYAVNRPGLGKNLDQYMKGSPSLLNSVSWTNAQVSNALVNEYLSKHESIPGVQKASELPTTGGLIMRYLSRISPDGLLALFSGGTLSGAWVATDRSQEFSENLARAPHVAGSIKMLMIAVFPWLLFFVVAGRWKVLLYWWLIYFSVLLWSPIWALLYHIMTSIALSAEVLEAFGRLNDGVSLYAAQLINQRIYHLFAVYAWLQILTGTAFTGVLLYFIRPAMSDTQADAAPEVIGTVSSGAGKAANTAWNAAGAAL